MSRRGAACTRRDFHGYKYNTGIQTVIVELWGGFFLALIYLCSWLSLTKLKISDFLGCYRDLTSPHYPHHWKDGSELQTYLLATTKQNKNHPNVDNTRNWLM